MTLGVKWTPCPDYKIHDVDVKKKVKVEEYYVLRGISKAHNKNIVLKEQEFASNPTLEEIAEFLQDENIGFCSVEHNYRIFDKDLPF